MTDKLLEVLTGQSQMSAVPSDRSTETSVQSLKIPSEPLPLDPDDYPQAKFWFEKDWKWYFEDWKNSGREPAKWAFLTNKDGFPVGDHCLKTIKDASFQLWNKLAQKALAPRTAAKISDTAWKFFSNTMHSNFLEFQFCDNNYKLCMYFTQKYPEFYQGIYKAGLDTKSAIHVFLLICMLSYSNIFLASRPSFSKCKAKEELERKVAKKWQDSYKTIGLDTVDVIDLDTLLSIPSGELECKVAKKRRDSHTTAGLDTVDVIDLDTLLPIPSGEPSMTSTALVSPVAMPKPLLSSTSAIYSLSASPTIASNQSAAATSPTLHSMLASTSTELTPIVSPTLTSISEPDATALPIPPQAALVVPTPIGVPTAQLSWLRLRSRLN